MSHSDSAANDGRDVYNKSETADIWPFPRGECPLQPPPRLAEVRQESGGLSEVLLPTGDSCVLATDYSDVKALLMNPDVSSNVRRPGFPHMSEAARANRGSQASFVRMDPPEHDVHRLMLTADFTVRRVRELIPFLEGFVDDLLDDMERAGGPIDLVRALCDPIPGVVIIKLLGLPMEDRLFFQDRMAIYMGNNSPEAISAANQDVLDYLDGVIGERLYSQQDDLISRLVRDQMTPGNLSRSELLQMLNLLVIAGFDTTANMIALGTVALIEHPEQLELLVNDPSLVPAAVEELLRFLSITHMTSARVSKAEVEVNGKVIPEGRGIIASIPAANHDPKKFENPGRLDFTRDARAHVAFGGGMHACLGQALARVELQVVFPRLFARFPTLRLGAPLRELPFKDGLVYGVTELLVDWEAK